MICLHITRTARGREGNAREKARKKDSSPVCLSQGQGSIILFSLFLSHPHNYRTEFYE